MSAAINTDEFSRTLRRRGVDLDSERLAITRFDGSEQEQDLTEPTNCAGHGRIRHFHARTSDGWPSNPLPIAPAAAALGWGPDVGAVRAQVFQNAICNWRCWYCFVDFPLLAGNSERSSMLSAADLFDLLEAEPEMPAVIDLTGGQPDLVPEWVLWMIRERDRRGLADQLYLWSDDNLSNDYFWSQLDKDQRATINAADAYGKVCCFKGFDAVSFAFNTGASQNLFERQFALMRRLVGQTELDLYAYATFTAPSERDVSGQMASFVDRLQEIDPSLPLRVVPLEVAAFTPTRARMSEEHDRALTVQVAAVAAWNEELRNRFHGSELAQEITDVELRR